MCWHNGRPFVCPKGDSEAGFFTGDYPPEEVTADAFEWDARLQRQYDRWCGVFRKRYGME